MRASATARKFHLSLNQIEGRSGVASAFRSGTVRRCEAAVATPIRDLSVAQLALLLRQGIGVEHVLPRAIQILREDPLVGDEYGGRGSLLRAVLKLPRATWERHPEERAEVAGLLDEMNATMADLAEARRAFMEQEAR